MGSASVQAIFNASSGSYGKQIAYVVPGSAESWASVIAANGTNGGTPLVNYSYVDSTPGPQGFTSHRFADFVFDLSEYNLVTFTSAIVVLGVSLISMSFGNQFSTDAAGGLALIRADETQRGNSFAITNYQALIDGAAAHGEMANRFDYTEVSHQSALFTLNATGLTYLNSVKSKSDMLNHAGFGVCFGGIVDSDTPTPPDAQGVMQYQLSSCALSLNWTSPSPVQINVGDVWKDAVGMQINQTGSAWQAVEDIDINVGDVWKDKA